MSKKLEIPSKEYSEMMDDILNKFHRKELEFSTIEEFLSGNGMSQV